MMWFLYNFTDERSAKVEGYFEGPGTCKTVGMVETYPFIVIDLLDQTIFVFLIRICELELLFKILDCR